MSPLQQGYLNTSMVPTHPMATPPNQAIPTQGLAAAMSSLEGFARCMNQSCSRPLPEGQTGYCSGECQLFAQQHMMHAMESLKTP